METPRGVVFCRTLMYFDATCDIAAILLLRNDISPTHHQLRWSVALISLGNTGVKIDDVRFFRLVHDSWRDGRSIVPIIGAGASADSGFPPLASVVRYIAKLSCYLTYKLYLPPSASESLFRSSVNQFAERPDRFISIFGWPDRFQLNAALRGRIRGMPIDCPPKKDWEKDPRRISRGLMDIAISHALDGLAERINPGGYWHLNNFLTKGVNTAIQNIESLKASNKEQVADYEQILKSLSEPANIESFRYQVVGDWKPLLRHITWYQPELVDALFARLARNRMPGTAHTLLAHLSNLLRIRVLFTFNFDPFIEAALTKENVPHRVFAMEHGTELPSRHHLDDSISVIKMHGSTHNILVDEKIDYRVSDRYKQQFLTLIGESPLLLVLGCSGNDRRLVDLVSDVMKDVPKATAVWVHHAKRDDVPSLLKDEARLSYFPTYDLGQSLQRLFEELTERLPNSTAPYVAHVNRPTIPDPAPNANKFDSEFGVHTRPLSIFSAHPRKVPRDFPSTSRDVLYALAEVPQGYTPVVIDLEEHHTLEQVVAEIIDQIRRADTALPPFVTSGGISEQNGGPLKARGYAYKAADCVFAALRRSRYALCISGIDAFPFRPTTHHGVTRQLSSADTSRFGLLFDFLLRLTRQIAADWTMGDSFVVLSHEAGYARHCRETAQSKSQRTLNRMLQAGLQKCAQVNDCRRFAPTPRLQLDAAADAESQHAQAWSTDSTTFYIPVAFYRDPLPACSVAIESAAAKHNSTSANAKGDSLIEIAVTALLAFHRRTRTKLGIKHLLRDIFKHALDDTPETVASLNPRFPLLDRLGTIDSIPPWMTWTKEDALWLDRPARDWVYDFNTRFTTETELTKKENRPKAFLQSLFAAILHDRIARNYYLNQFLPSRDPFLFMEYVYHRISTLRYLAQVEALTHLPDVIHDVRKADEILQIYARGIQPSTSRDTTAKRTVLTPRVIEYYADGADWASFFEKLAIDLTPLPTGRRDAFSDDVTTAIRTIRERCIHGLMETWVRCESYIRQALPPEQIVTWCENLLEYNLGESLDALPLSREHDRISALHLSLRRSLFAAKRNQALNEAFARLEETEAGKELTRRRGELVDAIKHTLFRAMYAHARFLKISTRTWESSRTSVSGIVDKRHWELNRQVAKLWACASRGDTSPQSPNAQEFNELLRKFVRQANSLRANRKMWPNESEARLRAFYLEVEARLAPHLADDSSFGHLRPVISESQEERKQLLDSMKQAGKEQMNAADSALALLKDTVIQNIEGAIEEAREEYGSTGSRMRNPLLEPTADRGLFVPYRSLFQIQLGRSHLHIATLLSRRARIACEFARLEELTGSALEGALTGAASNMKESRQHLTAAYRALAYAKNGIGIENSALLAISDLCCADVALAGSDHAVAWLYRKEWAAGERMVNRCKAKLDTASGYLTRCLSRLVQGPRMVLLWRVFHMTQVRYFIRRIAAISDEVTCEAKIAATSVKGAESRIDNSKMARRVGDLVRRVQLAVVGVRFGIDYSVGEDAIGFRNKFIKLWAQVAATALYAAAVMAHACQFVDNSLLDTLLSAWLDINHSEEMFALPESGIRSEIGVGVSTATRGRVQSTPGELAALREKTLHQRRMTEFREVVKQPLDRLLIVWDEAQNISGIIALRDQTWNEFTNVIHEFVSTGAGKDWLR